MMRTRDQIKAHESGMVVTVFMDGTEIGDKTEQRYV